MTQTTALDRDALYYPYIHIQDANWLKATLLCFPSVRRMVPGNYEPDDSHVVREFCELMGPRKQPLLSSVDLFTKGAMKAEANLLEKLKANDELIRKKYSKASTMQELGHSAEEFRLHDEKIMGSLCDYLTRGPENDALAWRTTQPRDRTHRRSSGMWLALHPSLGAAILSVKAVSIAQDFGLDIVTDSSGVHQTVVTQNEEDIFENLIGRIVPQRVFSAGDNVDDLAEIVMTTSFDVSKLSPKQIADLLSDGKDLRKFKNALVPIAASIPPMRDPGEREKRLKEATAEVIAEWQKYKKSLPKFALEAICESTEIKWPDVINSFFLGGGTALGLGVGAGLGIALVSYAGVKVWRKYKERTDSPYRYLNKIAALQATNHTLLSLPPAF
jgi:hypothetical protein